MNVCTSCGAPVVRLVHERTRGRAPIDAAPTPDGNVRLLGETGEYEVLTGDALAQARERGEALHLNHFVTCPDRKRRGGKGRPKRAG